MNAASPSAADRFACIIDGMCGAVVERSARGGGLSALLGILIWTRLRRMAARFAAVAVLVQARPSVSGPRSAAASAPRRGAEPEWATGGLPRAAWPPRVPSGFGWLLRLVPAAAAYGGQLRHLLAEPDVVALLSAAPKLGRVLRPLCRMLAIGPGPDMPHGLGLERVRRRRGRGGAADMACVGMPGTVSIVVALVSDAPVAESSGFGGVGDTGCRGAADDVALGAGRPLFRPVDSPAEGGGGVWDGVSAVGTLTGGALGGG